MMLTPLKFLSELPLFEFEKPYEMFGYPDYDSGKVTNCQYQVIEDIQVTDIRGSEASYSLDGAGFTYVKHRSNCLLEADYFESAGKEGGNKVVTSYLEETMGLVKTATGSDHVICFDWRFRRSPHPSRAMIQPQDVMKVRHQALPPGLTMHCDYSVDGGQERLEMHLRPEEYQQVVNGKCEAKIVNAWRALGTVENAPLIISDRRTVLRDELVEVDKVLPDKVEKGCYVKHRPYHKWYYMSKQTPEDVALFLTWNSKHESSFSDFPPHGAAMYFGDPEVARESLEVRIIALKYLNM